jgi:starch phosphorylase
MHVETAGGEHRFQVQVYLDELNADAVRVELYADGIAGSEPVRHVMVRGESLAGENVWRYSASVRADRPASDFVPRIIPYDPAAFVPLEAAQILWFR